MDRNRIKFQIQEYFTFSRGEKTGIIILICLIGLIIAAMFMIPSGKTESFDVSSFKKEIVRFEKSMDSLSGKNRFVGKDSIKFIAKQIYAHNSARILIPDLNSADSSSLEKLPGIGPVLASRIVKYRDLLGGFYSVNQIKEVYGIKPEVWQQIRTFIKIDTSKIRKISINTAEFREVNAHPYISYEQTKSIFRYRRSKQIKDISQLVDHAIFTSEEIAKLRFYLSME